MSCSISPRPILGQMGLSKNDIGETGNEPNVPGASGANRDSANTTAGEKRSLAARSSKARTRYREEKHSSR